MAIIELITGQTGNGKSLLAISKGLAFVAEGRTVYAAGFKELDYEKTGFLPLPTPFQAFDPKNLDDMQPNPNIRPDWQMLENAVIIYDECYSVLPSRSTGSKVPVHVDALARHRHYNIDLILLTQKHDQLDNFIRGLVNVHTHVKRKMGYDGAVLRHWDEFQVNTKATPDSKTLWRYPKQLYGLYKSATAHSIKKSYPWFIWAPIPLLAMIGGLVYYVTHTFGGKAAVAPTAASAAGGGAAAHTQRSSQDADDALRQRDYAKWMKPRMAGQPWTAPAYDTLRVQTVPRIFCAAMEDADCKCITEQGTRYVLDNPTCRAIARDGIYNPFLASSSERPPQQRQGERREADVLPPATADDLGGAKSAWPSSAMRASYVSPELTHAPPG